MKVFCAINNMFSSGSNLLRISQGCTVTIEKYSSELGGSASPCCHLVLFHYVNILAFRYHILVLAFLELHIKVLFTHLLDVSRREAIPSGFSVLQICKPNLVSSPREQTQANKINKY